jgi:hypothetical protein
LFFDDRLTLRHVGVDDGFACSSRKLSRSSLMRALHLYVGNQFNCDRKTQGLRLNLIGKSKIM